jgi:hypothetical protein
MSLRDANVSNANDRKRVAIVIANPTVSTTTGWATRSRSSAPTAVPASPTP